MFCTNRFTILNNHTYLKLSKKFTNVGILQFYILQTFYKISLGFQNFVALYARTIHLHQSSYLSNLEMY